MRVFDSKASVREFTSSLKARGRIIGFVPTMGALHKGHLSLVNKALTENDEVFVSIFVNPTQFNNQNDLANYPRTLAKDLEALRTIEGVIHVFAPTAEDIYDDHITSSEFDFDGLEFEMEGKFRAGHFDGVGTVISKLFEIVQPDNAYFGQKDYQQLLIIKKLVSKYEIPVNIVGCDIFRESNGLAMSSRNELLLPEHKENASFIYDTLKKAKEKFGTESANEVSEWVDKQFAGHEFLKLEYFEIADAETLKTVKRKSSKKRYRAFIAAYANAIRLIDNIPLN
ncbi:pantoate--beta-alanine ligase [Sungkyunkwania multivorans]|uniref:Pantothenate synthetase n=1 Tax=Sungkyunkwania multivorans TaxID=1173618 RepID=A0ABW3CZX0_9FLAO